MSKRDLSYCTNNHGLLFTIEKADITVEEMGLAVARDCINVRSELELEIAAHDITHAILRCVGKKVTVARVVSDRNGWIQRHPPNHAGFYYCHICGGWVHVTQAELDHIEPKSVLLGEDPNRDDNRRMAHAWPQFDKNGRLFCPGNRGKGSSRVESKTLEIAPPDGEI